MLLLWLIAISGSTVRSLCTSEIRAASCVLAASSYITYEPYEPARGTVLVRYGYRVMLHDLRLERYGCTLNSELTHTNLNCVNPTSAKTSWCDVGLGPLASAARAVMRRHHPAAAAYADVRGWAGAQAPGGISS